MEQEGGTGAVVLCDAYPARPEGGNAERDTHDPESVGGYHESQQVSPS